MGLLFVDKTISLLRLHSRASWVIRGNIIKTLSVETKPVDGFFFRQSDGRIKTVATKDAVALSLRDAQYWELLELDTDRSRLSQAGHDAKKGNAVSPDRLEAQLSDILHRKTSQLAGENAALDLAAIMRLFDDLPKPTIPTPNQLWLHFSTHTKVFSDDRLDYRRFRQLLSLMGTRGTGQLREMIVPTIFLEADNRLDTLLRKKEGKK
jgi:hypothetical protein